MITKRYIENLVRKELKILKEEKKVRKEALATSETDKLLKMIHRELVTLVSGADDIDTSIDQLAAALYGVLPGEVEALQKTMGRYAPLKTKKSSKNAPEGE